MCSISDLPLELIEEISEFTLKRHPQEGYVTDSSSLAAFSSTSRNFRTILTRILFREITASTEEHIVALSRIEATLLARTSEFNIFLDLPLLGSLKFWGFVRRGTGPPGCESPFDGLARILSRTPNLSAFRILSANQMAEAGSAWSPQFIQSPFTIPISDALCRSGVHISLPNLLTLELDGFSDIDLLLRATPNLQRLCLRLSGGGGFPQSFNVELVRNLKYVPQLRELVYTPSTLCVLGETTLNPVSIIDDNNIDVDGIGPAISDDIFWNPPGEGEYGTPPIEDEESWKRIELIRAIGSRTPFLQNLVLEARWYGGRPTFCAPHDEILSLNALIRALSNFKQLEILALPTTVIHVEQSRDDDEEHADLTAALRHETLIRVAQAEQDIVSALFDRKRTLRMISFTRPLLGNKVLHAVQYTTHPAPPLHYQEQDEISTESSYPMPSMSVIKTRRCATTNQYQSEAEPLPFPHIIRPKDSKHSMPKPSWQRCSLRNIPFDATLMTASVMLAVLGGRLMG